MKVNGAVADLGRRVDVSTDRVTVDGAPLPGDPELRYLALHKPAGVTSTLRDPHAERSLAELLPEGPRIVPVGRLDRDSEGLLLFTNDGELSFRLQHPRFGVEKEYVAEVDGEISREALRALTDGVELTDGRARVLAVPKVDRMKGRSAVTLVMGEGRKREVRRLLEAVGFPVLRLVRTRFGPIPLGRLAPGEHRLLAATEISELYRTVGLDRAVRGTFRSTGGAGIPPRARQSAGQQVRRGHRPRP